MTALGNNRHGRWTRLIGAANGLVQAARRLDRQDLPWERWEIDALLDLYPVLTNPELAELFGRSQAAVKRAGFTAGVRRKLPEVVERAARQAQASPNTKATQFRKGNVPHGWQPIGTEVIDCDGYRKRKIRDGCQPATYNWEFVHVLLWIEHHGPIPPGHVVRFRNGDKGDIRIDNLELLSYADNMRRNTRHRYPEPINHLISLQAAITRRVNNLRKKAHE